MRLTDRHLSSFLVVSLCLIAPGFQAWSADIRGEFRVSPASPNVEVVGAGYRAVTSVEPEGRVLYPLLPLSEMMLVATPLGEDQVTLRGHTEERTLRFSDVSSGDLWLAVPPGTAVTLENDTDRALQARHSGSGETLVIAPETEELVFQEQLQPAGLHTIEIQASQGAFRVLVIDGPFAVADLENGGGGIVQVEFPGSIERGGPDEPHFRLSLWFRGQQICLSSTLGECATEVSGSRDDGDVVLAPVTLSNSLFIGVRAP